MDFKEYLATKRKEKKIPVRTFAKLVGISPSFLCDLESGHRSFPSDPKIATELFPKMAHALNLSPEEEATFKALADQSVLEGGKLPSDLRNYLLQNPKAQLALRKAKEKGITNDLWEDLIQEFDK